MAAQSVTSRRENSSLGQMPKHVLVHRQPAAAACKTPPPLLTDTATQARAPAHWLALACLSVAFHRCVVGSSGEAPCCANTSSQQRRARCPSPLSNANLDRFSRTCSGQQQQQKPQQEEQDQGQQHSKSGAAAASFRPVGSRPTPRPGGSGLAQTMHTNKLHSNSTAWHSPQGRTSLLTLMLSGSKPSASM